MWRSLCFSLGLAATMVQVAAAEPSANGTYSVGTGYYNVHGYQCGDQSSKTKILYPKGTGPFHVVVYGHGAYGYIDGFDDWLTTIASMGLIVIAPYTGAGKTCAENEDMLLAFSESRKGGASLHSALGTADWSRTGVFGHSMGAKHVPQVASTEGYNITCMLASHDGTTYDESKLKVPAMWTTGTEDETATADPKKAFEACPSRPRIFANVKGAGHSEPGEGKSMNTLTAQFLSCHVNQNKDHCAIIYGSGANSLCKVNKYAECIVDTKNAVVV